METERPVTLVDSNVLLDIATDDPRWGSWSSQALAEAVDTGSVCVNPVVYAEVSVRFDRVEDVDDFLPADVFARAALPYEAGFLAGKAFVTYRRRGGARRTPLPAFYVGAHAATARLRLLTRDAGRFRTYFPTVEVLSPP